MLPKGAVVMVLGTITHNAVLMALQLRKGDFAFKRGAQHLLPNGATLFDSYHCSRYNTQTKRFTTQMFEDVVASVAEHLKSK